MKVILNILVKMQLIFIFKLQEQGLSIIIHESFLNPPEDGVL